MCTIMTQRETLPAEIRSRKASQDAVDKLMDYERELKNNPHAETPCFDDGIFGCLFSRRQHGTGKIYVWLDSMCFGNSAKKGFYYVRWYNSMLDCSWGGIVSTAYGHPALIVQKDKLRTDQIEYMERKCQETKENKDQEITWGKK